MTLNNCVLTFLLPQGERVLSRGSKVGQHHGYRDKKGLPVPSAALRSLTLCQKTTMLLVFLYHFALDLNCVWD